ncbi:hypothetical protein FA15DRAFT_143244 [Coprinopsis marcescibilis]|uniref:MFS general substrate transporter n=1 Tax=Coprinopsis marcescibilis TaxID=230819 RepID=A0A5C3KJJ1_COPMA|nr:hypothetical protein FA15DRAFT_143244 [Coprinopsis marcescibilis]
MYLASIAGIGLSAFAMSISPWSAWLLVSRLLQIVSASLICPLSIAIISVNYKHSIRASRIGILLGLRTISQFIAPLAVFLPYHQRGRYEWRLWFLGAMIISAALFAALYQVLPTSRAPDSEGSTLPSAPDRRLAWMSPSTTFAALYRCRAAFIVSVVSAPMFGAVFEGFRIYCRDDPKIWSVHQWQAAIYRGLSGPVFPEEFVVAAFSLFVYELGSAVGDVFIGFVLDRLARHSSPEAGSTNRLTGGFFPSLVLVPACFAVIVYCHPVSGEFFLGWVFILGIGIHSILGVGIVFVAEADPKRAVELLSAREVIQLGPGIVFSLLVLCFNQRQSLIFGSALAILLSLVVFATFWKLVRVGSGPPTSVSISSSDGDGAQIAPAPSS